VTGEQMIPVIIVPVLNRYDLLQRCVDSIDTPVQHLVVVDNGGAAKITENRMVDKTWVWSMPSGLGVPVSWNLGIKATSFADGWLIVGSDVWFPPGVLEQFYSTCRPDMIQTGGSPAWACFWIGAEVVAKVGLFCEQFMPIYFEDLDYERRAKHHGFRVEHSWLGIGHNNSSTIHSDPRLLALNGRTFAANQALFARRLADGATQSEEWDLTRRRDLSWD